MHASASAQISCCDKFHKIFDTLDVKWVFLVVGKIVQSTLEECREAYATWINMVFLLFLFLLFLSSFISCPIFICIYQSFFTNKIVDFSRHMNC